MLKKNNLIVTIIVVGLILLLWWYFSPSSSSRPSIDLSSVEKTVSIHHFDDALFTADSSDIQSLIKNLNPEFSPFFQSNAELTFWRKQRLDKGQNQLYSDWKGQLKDYGKFDKNLQLAFKHLYYYYPDLPEYKVYTYISNLDFDYPILIADDLVFVAVDMYLGPRHPAYQRDPNYLNYNRQKEFLSRDILASFSVGFAQKNPEENTLLNEMIFWGKTRYFIESMQPNQHDSVLHKMSSTELELCLENEQNIWSYFIKNKLLFDTSDKAKRTFIEPAPFSKFGMPFDSETPGMIGRWLGYRIVESYMNNNTDITLQQLMDQPDTRNIFKNSKYKP